MQGPMMPMHDLRRRRLGGMPGIGALDASVGSPPMMGLNAPPPIMAPSPEAPPMGSPSTMAGGGMGPGMMSPERAEELRRWFMQNRPGAMR